MLRSGINGYCYIVLLVMRTERSLMSHLVHVMVWLCVLQLVSLQAHQCQTSRLNLRPKAEMCVHAYIHTYVCACLRHSTVYAHTHTHTRTHTRIYIDMYTTHCTCGCSHNIHARVHTCTHLLYTPNS